MDTMRLATIYETYTGASSTKNIWNATDEKIDLEAGELFVYETLMGLYSWWTPYESNWNLILILGSVNEWWWVDL